MEALINKKLKQKQKAETDASGSKRDPDSVGGTRLEVNPTLTNSGKEKNNPLVFSPSTKSNPYQQPANKKRYWERSGKVVKSEIDRCGNSKGRYANFEYGKYERK